MSYGSRGYMEREDVRRSRRSRFDDDEREIARARVRRQANTRPVYVETPTESKLIEPVILGERRVGIVDKWKADAGFGFVLEPAIKPRIFFVHARDLCFDEREMHPGLTVVFSEKTEQRAHVTGRRTAPPRGEAGQVMIAPEQIAAEIEATVSRIMAQANGGNAWLDNKFYFPFASGSEQETLRVGDRVKAWVCDAPKGPRAVNVRRI